MERGPHRTKPAVPPNNIVQQENLEAEAMQQKLRTFTP
jgi:hypothetical protein